ncbi:mechanosensitive ion channel family protein, partial [Candidatus Saccharibacteria bacterium QS_8_54_8]
DVIDLDGDWGVVEDITLRYVSLRDLDGAVHHIPHSTVDRVKNLSKDFGRINLDIGVSYGSDINQVIKVVDRIGKELADDEDWREIIITPPQFWRVDNFSDSSIEVKIVGETTPLMQWSAAGEYRKRLKNAFDEEGIEIPFPQRVIHTDPKNPKDT